MATESTEEHGNINALKTIFSCSSVDSVAINKDPVPNLIWRSLSEEYRIDGYVTAFLYILPKGYVKRLFSVCFRGNNIFFSLKEN